MNFVRGCNSATTAAAIILFALFTSASAVLSSAQAASDPTIDVKLFSKSEVDRSRGCTVALWQHNRDPDRDRYAYVFVERLGKNHARAPAKIKIGNKVIRLRRVATGGKNNGYDLYAYQLYKMPGNGQYVVLDLKLGELEGEAVAIEGGTMSVVMGGKRVFQVSVKGGAGCMTAAAPSPSPQAAATDTPRMFRPYAVRRVPAAFVRAGRNKYGCDAAFMKTGVRGFQLSEESAIWQIPCESFAYQTTAVYALVYLPDPTQNLAFLTFQSPRGHRRSNDPGVLMSPQWNIRTRTVTSISRGRALGDCGVLERHRVTAEGNFKLVEYREKPRCDGKPGKPEQFPLVFRAR